MAADTGPGDPGDPVDVGTPGRRIRVSPRAASAVLSRVWSHPANRGRRARSVAGALTFQVGGRLLGRPWQARLGQRSRVWAEPHAASARAVYANPPDWAEMTAWRRLLAPGDLFVDVGANIGLYTIWALDCGAEVVAVEPHGGAADDLERNLALNGYRAEVLRVALADKPGTMRLAGVDLPRQHLVLGGGAGGGGHPDEGPGADVPVETLDAVLGDRVAAGVKIDVEGAEALVLAGAIRALSERRIRALQLEWNECSADLLGQDRTPVAELLEGHGYRLYRPDGTGALLDMSDAGYGPDMFALPQP